MINVATLVIAAIVVIVNGIGVEVPGSKLRGVSNGANGTGEKGLETGR